LQGEQLPRPPDEISSRQAGDLALI
jgi:hypothetical protein